jgi:type I restriction enzyme R subunit
MTLGFFDQNLVMEHNHDEAVADGVNVDFDVYRIRTKITEQGSRVDAGFFVDKRDRQTRAVRYEQLDRVVTPVSATWFRQTNCSVLVEQYLRFDYRSD